MKMIRKNDAFRSKAWTLGEERSTSKEVEWSWNWTEGICLSDGWNWTFSEGWCDGLSWSLNWNEID